MLGGNVGNKNKVEKKQQNIIAGGSKVAKPKIVLITLAFVVSIIGGVVLFIASGYDLKSITSPNCSNDNELIARYSGAIQNTANNDEYAKINEVILNKLKYQDDITCSYILFNNYLKFGNFVETSEEYMRIKAQHGNNKTIPAGLFNVDPNIDSLLQEYKYFDTEATPEETGEVWG